MTTPPRRILVADDNIINQKIIVKMLERSNIVSDVVCDGVEAVDAVKKCRYDLILMDVQMPNMDGLEATRAIRTLESKEYHTAIIAVTANAMSGDRERCLESGMDDYLAKPIIHPQLIAMVNKWVPVDTLPENSGKPATEPLSPLIIDPKRIHQIKDIGDESLLREILELYIQDLDQFLTDVLAAQKRKDFQQIFECSHKLKGSSANVGVVAMTNACVVLEQHAKAKNIERVNEQFSAILPLIEHVRSHIVKTYF